MHRRITPNGHLMILIGRPTAFADNARMSVCLQTTATQMGMHRADFAVGRTYWTFLPIAPCATPNQC